MRTITEHSALKLAASLGLLVLATWTSLPVRAADQQVAALSRPCAAAGSVCASEIARRAAVAPAAVAVRPAVKPVAAQPATVKSSRPTNYERDLWRHQGVG